MPRTSPRPVTVVVVPDRPVAARFIGDTVSGDRRGKAPAGNPDVRFEDWLPTLKRASKWNRWSEEESLLQLAGHLRGKALQEWNLLSAVEAIRRRIDPHNRVIAATDFRHASQAEGADYIRRLFQLAYGGDRCETRDTMLHGQLHGGLRYDVVKSPVVPRALFSCQTGGEEGGRVKA